MQSASWANESFVKRTSICLPGSTFGSVALRTTGSGYGSSLIAFKRSGGFGVGSNLWPNDDDAVTVTVLGGYSLAGDEWKATDLQLLISHPFDGQPYLIINFNNGNGGGSGNQTTYFSENMGRSWVPIPSL